MTSSNDFFQGGQVGFKFLGIEKVADDFGIPAAPFRFIIGILLGKLVKFSIKILT